MDLGLHSGSSIQSNAVSRKPILLNLLNLGITQVGRLQRIKPGLLSLRRYDDHISTGFAYVILALQGYRAQKAYKWAGSAVFSFLSMELRVGYINFFNHLPSDGISYCHAVVRTPSHFVADETQASSGNMIQCVSNISRACLPTIGFVIARYQDCG